MDYGHYLAQGAVGVPLRSLTASHLVQSKHAYSTSILSLLEHFPAPTFEVLSFLSPEECVHTGVTCAWLQEGSEDHAIWHTHSARLIDCSKSVFELDGQGIHAVASV